MNVRPRNENRIVWPSAYQKRKTGAKSAESEQRFRSLVDIAPVMVWMSGTDACCAFFNKPWLDFTGLSVEEQAKQDWVARVHPDDRERAVDQYLSAFESRETFNLEYRLLRKDGSYRWMLHHGVPTYAADSTFIGYIGSRVDFTDQREAVERLREVSAQRINEQEIESFRIAGELHEDLAQKVVALSLRVSRLSRKCDGDRDVAADLDVLQVQLKDLCRDIVRLSRQLRPVSVEALGLPAALRDLCDHSINEERAVVFFEDENLPRLRNDISLVLYLIAQEALRNALAHSGATDIRVELSASATTVRLSVKDNGCGFVVGSMTKPVLGLSGMSERMKNAGGEFTIISSPGEGTAMIATMPLMQSMQLSAMAQQTLPVPPLG